ncbi:MAG: hypothetical protein HN794_06590 [Euryarchaeota archaeon]|nr:hypothetical protein [Euryarchaeota archaeon]MBT4925216.1 hypothetical protein [Euryarchaeota archaeon]MBT5736313.1 hypothetical protein [Euryarchaeota archaeon]MBT7460696.1 hypothetical protein [Euryarchaeota archaeon]
MTEQKGDPVGLRMGLQAGALIGLYLGFSLATISVLTDAEEVKRTVYLICLPPFIVSILLGPFLAKRRKPVKLSKKPLEEARELLTPYNEGQGSWRVLSHVSSDGMNIRIDMHNLKNVEGVVEAALKLADSTTVKFVVGRGTSKSVSPELRDRVLSVVETKVNILRRTRKVKSIEVSPEKTREYNEYQNRLNKILFALLPIVSFLAWLEMKK